MDTKIVYFDETGDDGNNIQSSTSFTLTGTYMYADDWQENFNSIKLLRQSLKSKYGFPIKQEMHITPFIRNKYPFCSYKWDDDQRRDILRQFLWTICQLKIEIVNVIIDKSKITSDSYPILENALKYNLQRIENTSNGDWNYIAISDSGRVKRMVKTARAIRVYNPIQNMFDYDSRNLPVKYMIEDILEKDSSDSYFIQVSDFISYFVHLYYNYVVLHKALPNRVERLLTADQIEDTMKYLKGCKVLNLKASHTNKYGIVIYPK